jgi:HEAT repeat protein
MSIKILIYIFLLLVVSSSLNSQTVERFKSDFSKIDTNTFDEDSRTYFFKLYNPDLTPYGYRSDLEYRKLKYPYAELLNDSIYTERIEHFFNSENEELRELSFYTISAVGDNTYEKRMVDSLLSETENSKFQLCMALMRLETDRTSVIFDYILQNKFLNELLLSIPLYQRLDKDSLRNTAYQHFYDDNPEARNLAYLFLKETELNEKTDKLLKQAVVSVDIDDRIKIVEVIKELQVGNLKEVLIPLLDSSKTRRVSLQALANSPTKSDRQVLIDLINSKDTLDNDLLYCLMSSKNLESNKLWLKVIQTHQVPSLYYPNLHHRGVYHSDELLPLVQEAIINTDNTEILSELIEVLGSREDEKSLNLVFDAMRHEDLKVRESATQCLRWNSSELIKEQVESILYDSNVRTEEIVYLAIMHNFNRYQTFFENLFKDSEDLFWRRASIKYLSVFPLEKHQKLFESLLEDYWGDRSIKHSAAIGLGNLNDTNSIDLIIELCDKGDEYDARFYLKALGKLKGDKAKAHLLLHKDSDDNEVRELVETILNEWDE